MDNPLSISLLIKKNLFLCRYICRYVYLKLTWIIKLLYKDANAIKYEYIITNTNMSCHIIRSLALLDLQNKYFKNSIRIRTYRRTISSVQILKTKYNKSLACQRSGFSTRPSTLMNMITPCNNSCILY